MWSYIWPKDNRPVRRRVVSSLGLLVAAKALNVQVGLNFLATLLHDYFKTFFDLFFKLFETRQKNSFFVKKCIYKFLNLGYIVLTGAHYFSQSTITS